MCLRSRRLPFILLLMFSLVFLRMPVARASLPRSVVSKHYNAARTRGLPEDGLLLLVSVRDQRLAVIESGACRLLYRVSTSKWGAGSARDSNRTPLGWHRVAEWIGGNARPGQVFVARRPTDQVLPHTEWRSIRSGDHVLTRILWLDGIEPGRNRGGMRDSRSRFIYLHGTNQEHLLGRPASHGCIRLSNRDVMELYDLTTGRTTYCLIVAESLTASISP